MRTITIQVPELSTSIFSKIKDHFKPIQDKFTPKTIIKTVIEVRKDYEAEDKLLALQERYEEVLKRERKQIRYNRYINNLNK